jgi:hypothetical protein
MWKEDVVTEFKTSSLNSRGATEENQRSPVIIPSFWVDI